MDVSVLWIDIFIYLYYNLLCLRISMRRNPDELLMFVFDAVSKIASMHNHDDLLSELARLCRDIVFAERCSIWILNKRTEKLWTKVAHGVDPIEIDSCSGIVGHAVREKKDFIINDVQKNEHFYDHIDNMTGYITKAMMVIPMIRKGGEVIGVIQVINKKENATFSKRDLRYVKLVSSYAAESIETILLREEIDQTQKELINIMGVTGENRSKETGFHVKRVSEYSWLLAKLYGLTESECEMLRDVSPMHDIGKIGISDAILNKPARLDDSEICIMKTHTQLGYNILKYSEFKMLKSAAIVAHEHHEKYNGKGYPPTVKR